MASPLQIRSYWTEVSVDASQDTPKTSPAAAENIARATHVECIEDSMKIATIHRSSGPFQSSALHDDADDELYALSPQGRKSLEAVLSSMQMSQFSTIDRNQDNEHSSKNPKAHILDDCMEHLKASYVSNDEVAHEVSPVPPVSKKEPNEEAKRDGHVGCMNTNLRQIQAPASGTVEGSSRKFNTGGEHGTAKSAIAKSSVPSGRGTAKSSSGAKQYDRSTASVTKTSKPVFLAPTSQSVCSIASVNGKPKPVSAAPSSTLAALYAKRNSHIHFTHRPTVTTAPTASSATSLANMAPSSIRPVLQERDSNLQTLARPTVKENTVERSTAAESRPRRQEMVSQALFKSPEAQQTVMIADDRSQPKSGVRLATEEDLSEIPQQKRKYPAIEDGHSDHNEVQHMQCSVKDGSEVWSQKNGSMEFPTVGAAGKRQSISDMSSSPGVVKPVKHRPSNDIASFSTRPNPALENSVETKNSKNDQVRESETVISTIFKDQNQGPLKEEKRHVIGRNDPPVLARHRHLILPKDNNADGSISDYDQSFFTVPADMCVMESKEVSCNEEKHRNDYKQPKSNGNLGASLEYPIVVSDQFDSVSSIDSPASHATALNSFARNDLEDNFQRIPQTPVNIRSSPPVSNTSALRSVRKNVVDRYEMRKSAVISFDRSGPRNQGMRKSGIESFLTTRSSLPLPGVDLPLSDASPAFGRSGVKFKSGPSSVSETLRTSKSMQIAPPSNIAGNVTDALDGFVEKFRKGESTPESFRQAMEVRGIQKKRNGLRSKTREPMDHDDQFPLLDHTGYSKFLDVGPTHTDKPHLLNSTPLRTASQLAMPPPALMIGKRAEIREKPLASLNPNSTNLQPSFSNDGCRSKKMNTKLSHENESLVTPAAKRLRYSERLSVKNENQLAVCSPALFCESKDSQLTTNQKVKNNKEQPAKRVHDKPSRHASQGRVDIGGSPAPKGYDFPANELLREHYSQHAVLSSDRSSGEALARNEDENRNQVQHNSRVIEEKLVLPTHQPEVFSSNRKTQPASPEKESQAITTIAVGIVDKENLVVQDAAATPATDPFTTSEQTSRAGDPAPISMSFGERLQRSGVRQRYLSAEFSGAAEADTNQANIPLSDQWKKTEHDTSTTQPEQLHYRRMFSKVTMPHDEVEGSSKKVHHRRVSSEDTSTTSQDLGVWRSTLKSHQQNLFDELVIISYRLVCNLVAREEAMRDMIDDYRRCGLQLVEDMEKDMAEKYQKRALGLADRREKLRRDLGEFSDKLTKCTDVVKEARFQRMKQASERAEEERKLREVMERVC